MLHWCRYEKNELLCLVSENLVDEVQGYGLVMRQVPQDVQHQRLHDVEHLRHVHSLHFVRGARSISAVPPPGY